MDEKKNNNKNNDKFKVEPKDIEKFFKKFFANFIEIPFPPTDSDVKDFNYSFKFDSAGKDNYEAKFNDSNLIINDIKEFLFNKLSDPAFKREKPEIMSDTKDISIRKPNTSTYLEPMYDIIDNNTENLVEIVMELPGISEKKVKIHYLDQNEIIIIGENEEKTYRKSFTLKFIPDRRKTKISSINNIFRIIIREGGEK